MKLAVLTATILLSTMPLFSKQTKETTFWKWFAKNESGLFEFEKDREAIFDSLSQALNKVHPDFTFEFSPILSDGKREFIVSAGGIKAAFPKVHSLVEAAPEMKKWTILKFRQRRSPINNVEFKGKLIRSEDVHYAIFKDQNPDKIGIMLFLDGYTKDDPGSIYGQISYLMLDEALGEYDVEMNVGAIVLESRESKYFEHGRPIEELPNKFDERLGRK